MDDTNKTKGKLCRSKSKTSPTKTHLCGSRSILCTAQAEASSSDAGPCLAADYSRIMALLQSVGYVPPTSSSKQRFGSLASIGTTRL